jgi:hypothetical protein
MKIFLTKKLTVGKLGQIGSTQTFEYDMSETEYDCTEALQLSPEETQLYEGQIGQLEKRLSEIGCTAEIGDKIVIDGDVYKVKGVSKSPYGSVKFLKIIMVKSDGSQSSNSESGSS